MLFAARWRNTAQRFHWLPLSTFPTFPLSIFFFFFNKETGELKDKITFLTWHSEWQIHRNVLEKPRKLWADRADHALCPTNWRTSFLLGKSRTKLFFTVFTFLSTHTWFFFSHYHLLNISQHIIYFPLQLQDLWMPFFFHTMNRWLKYLDFQKNTIIQYTSNLLSQCANKVERRVR